MSLINQVLSDLEKRGADTPLADGAVRVVAQQTATPPSRVWLVLAGGGIAAALAAGGWWMFAAPVQPLADATPAPAPQVAAYAVSEVVAASAPEAPPELAAPASRLSFELSGIPLPNSLRSKPQEPSSDVKPKPVAPQAVAKPAPPPPPPVQAAAVDKQVKTLTPAQQAENEYRKANSALQQGVIAEAMAGYQAALHLDPSHVNARQALVGVLLNNRRSAEAEQVLQEGLLINHRQTGFAMLLARLQVERNAVSDALETLQKTLPFADGQADYQAFTAALMQRQARHKEAITHYQHALQLQPNNGVWLMGLGISLQAVQRMEEARDAYKRALATRSLSTGLQSFVNQKLKELP